MLFTFPIPQLLLLKIKTDGKRRTKNGGEESGKVSIDGMAGTH